MKGLFPAFENSVITMPERFRTDQGVLDKHRGRMVMCLLARMLAYFCLDRIVKNVRIEISSICLVLRFVSFTNLINSITSG